MTDLTDDLLKRLAESRAPHAYSHEVKAMAAEIIRRREAEKTPTTPPPHPWLGGAGIP